MHACTLTRHTVHTHTHAHMHTCTHAHMHTCTHAHMHTCTHAHTHLRAYMEACRYATYFMADDFSFHTDVPPVCVCARIWIHNMMLRYLELQILLDIECIRSARIQETFAKMRIEGKHSDCAYGTLTPFSRPWAQSLRSAIVDLPPQQMAGGTFTC